MRRRFLASLPRIRRAVHVKRYYNRLFLLSALIFIVIVFSFGIFLSILASRLSISTQLQYGREALGSVCAEYDNKHDEFYNLLLPFYNSPQGTLVLSAIMEGSGIDNIEDPIMKKNAVDVVHDLTVQDKDIVAVLFQRESDSRNYVYLLKDNSFSPGAANFPFFDRMQQNKSNSRGVYGVQTWGAAGRRTMAYGIATANLSTRNIRDNAGTIMVAYDVSALHLVFQKYQSTSPGRALIVSKEGDVIFDSARLLYGSRYPNMQLIDRDGTNTSVDGVTSSVLVIGFANRGYYGIYIESDSTLNARIARNNLTIFEFCMGVSLLAILLYLFAGIISTRKVQVLMHAMDTIGAKGLSHRIPLKGSGDEFEHIAERFNLMCDDLQENVEKLYINELKQKNAELSALQSGINPHFLYNTLEAIRSKAQEDGNDDVADSIVRVASLLRSLVRSSTFISLRQEMDFCRMYMGMFILRYADRFDFVVDVDPAVLEYGVPKGFLQPVLENYFIHGIRANEFDNRLSISSGLDEGWITIVIEDNGKGMDPAQLDEIRMRLKTMDAKCNSLGLPNVQERIHLVFGSGSGLSIESVGGNGTVVTVRIRAISCDDLNMGMGDTR
jgi:two-component system sensor histidine kinase YesM